MAGTTSGDLASRVAVITGGGRGIGAAIAQKLAGMGALVVICGRRQKPLESTVKTIIDAGGKAKAAECDVMDVHSVEKLAAQVERDSGRLDVLVNNGGSSGCWPQWPRLWREFC